MFCQILSFLFWAKSQDSKFYDVELWPGGVYAQCTSIKHPEHRKLERIMDKIHNLILA